MGRQRISKISKRDGRTVGFEVDKISNAIQKALNATGTRDGKLVAELAKKVVLLLESKAGALPVPSVEEVQDAVERVLSEEGLHEVAKAYILYRQMRADVRRAREFVGVPVNDLKVSVNAAKVLSHRYLLKDDQGKTIETPSRLFRRVAIAVAAAEKLYDPDADVKALEEAFYNLMAGFEFIPNSPTLMNAGTSMGQLAACFVIPVEDSIPAIFDSVKHMAIIHQSGGGTGFSFSRLRPKGDLVKSTKGVASGPVSFMRVFDVATDVIKQGGRRRGANMGILRCDHPDIIEFITAKKKEGFLDNFNISVAVTDEFMEAVTTGGDVDLINPRTGEAAGKASAKELFDLIVAMAWTTGDPGLFFIDRANAANPTPDMGIFESTNPCGEIPLLPNEPCNLGSINLHKMMQDGAVDWDKLKDTVRLSVRFLDNVIDAGKYPLPQIDYMAKANRKIGLGVMGFAEM
ncbi:MAG: adenosylcobalamin-dependent ribonucleoside-diphosphate reductase, partial [Candidatus Aquicultor sp.]|nr:adenosylcobalamin-dependent ribonucleoside-diphosphate reductase [Candidatus Aquicultor sp.]